MGRFYIWFQSVFDALDVIYGATGKITTKELMANANLACISNSDKVQSAFNLSQRANKKYLHKKNPLVSIKALVKLNAHNSGCENIGVY